MSVFQYRAIQSDGSISEGQLDAPGRQEAYRQLEVRGLKAVGLIEGGGDGKKEGRALPFHFSRKKVPFRALENFTRQLSSLLSAGVPLSRAFQILHRETSLPAAKEQWKLLHDQVIDGKSLADAMGRSPETFPKVYVAMVQAGEAGGFLDVVLDQIAEFQGREKELRAKVVSSLIYPCVLLVLAIGVLIFLMTFFIPRFKVIFDDLGGELPALTQMIVATSEWIGRYGSLAGAFGVVGVIALLQWLKSARGRSAWQWFVLRIPLIGPLNAKFSMTRFCRMLGTLTGAGVPLIQSLKVARESIGNGTLTDAVTNSIERVEQGQGLAESLSDCEQLFAGSVLEMISVAEESGRLEKELLRIAATTDKDLDRQLRTTVALAEPLMLFLMAGFVGVIFIGMVIPIFTIQDYIQ